MSNTAAATARVDRAVWSFWSRPFATYYHRSWADDLFHLLSWVLSFRTASCHVGSTALVTDDDGARLLVDRLALPFDHVSTSLNTIPEEYERWWALGKLYAYRQQD